MTFRFLAEPDPNATALRLRGPAGPVPVDRWALEAPDRLLRGVDLVHSLVAAETAIAEAETVLIEHRAIAGLAPEQAVALGLPPAVEAVAVIETAGIVSRPDFEVRLRWERSTGQPLPGVKRVGAWIDLAGAWRRVPEPLFSIAEAVDRFAALDRTDEAGRLRALAELRELLPGALENGRARAPGMLGRLRIAVADAFSLDVEGEGDRARLVPVLHRAGSAAEGEEPPLLLDPARQARFGRELFTTYTTARGVYVLGSGDWVALTPTLRKALAVVREVQDAPWPVKRSLLRSPRAFLADRLGDTLDATVLETLFVETRAFGERVRGIGLWQPRIVPWVELQPTDWFGPESGGKPPPTDRPRPARGGLWLGEQKVPLTLDEATALRKAVEDAVGRGEAQTRWHHPELGQVELPASSSTLAAIQAVIDGLSPARTEQTGRAAAGGEGAEPGREALLIEPNESELGFEACFERRPSPPVASFARGLKTQLKEHQRDGVLWLQRSWEAGRPGVLLADEMGLGKTLQVLAFLAWLREAMDEKIVARGPFLIVAPTGLLTNWKAEHDRHLAPLGLGTLVEAFGKGLAALKRTSSEGRPALDREKLAEADWILTSYETLRDYDLDFGAVRFAVLAFDEAQKIKNPGIRLTDAAKAMQATFSIAMTGTPVENRLADLWCITDTVHPGMLGELRAFSETWERKPDPDALRRLRRRLDRADRVTPPFMLRRLRADHLADLPPFEVERRERPMPEPQLRAYEAAREQARARPERGAVLEALLRLRAVSLHPEPELPEDDELVARSARLGLVIEVLDAIAGKDQAALLFLDDLDFAARLQGLLQRRYRLAEPPALISGEVAGGRRQRIVDRFQRGRGFGVLLITPRAGGVGLTLTRANHVIHLARWWNPAVEDQCNGRVLRIGQERPVTIHLPLAVLPDGRRSFDQNLDALLERKRRLHAETLAPPAAEDNELEALFETTVGRGA